MILASQPLFMQQAFSGQMQCVQTEEAQNNVMNWVSLGNSSLNKVDVHQDFDEFSREDKNYIQNNHCNYNDKSNEMELSRIFSMNHPQRKMQQIHRKPLKKEATPNILTFKHQSLQRPGSHGYKNNITGSETKEVILLQNKANQQRRQNIKFRLSSVVPYKSNTIDENTQCINMKNSTYRRHSSTKFNRSLKQKNQDSTKQIGCFKFQQYPVNWSMPLMSEQVEHYCIQRQKQQGQHFTSSLSQQYLNYNFNIQIVRQKRQRCLIILSSSLFYGSLNQKINQFKLKYLIETIRSQQANVDVLIRFPNTDEVKQILQVLQHKDFDLVKGVIRVKCALGEYVKMYDISKILKQSKISHLIVVQDEGQWGWNLYTSEVTHDLATLAEDQDIRKVQVKYMYMRVKGLVSFTKTIQKIKINFEEDQLKINLVEGVNILRNHFEQKIIQEKIRINTIKLLRQEMRKKQKACNEDKERGTISENCKRSTQIHGSMIEFFKQIESNVFNQQDLEKQSKQYINGKVNPMERVKANILKYMKKKLYKNKKKGQQIDIEKKQKRAKTKTKKTSPERKIEKSQKRDQILENNSMAMMRDFPTEGMAFLGGFLEITKNEKSKIMPNENKSINTEKKGKIKKAEQKARRDQTDKQKTMENQQGRKKNGQSIEKQKKRGKSQRKEKAKESEISKQKQRQKVLQKQTQKKLDEQVSKLITKNTKNYKTMNKFRQKYLKWISQIAQINKINHLY